MIAIVVDSTVYMTSKEARLYGVYVVPASYSIGSRIYNEKYIDIPFNERAVYSSMSECSTYHPKTVDFLNVFRYLSEKKADIICITVSSKLSSAYNSALLAKKYIQKSNIRIIDSELTAGGLYLLVKKACALVKSGCEIDEIENNLNEIKQRIKIKFTVDEIASLSRSKRISFLRSSVYPILNYKPILILKNGSVHAEISARSGYDRIKRLVSEIPAGARLVIINYAEQTLLFSYLVKYLTNTRPGLVIEMRKIGPAVGINVGRTAIAVVWSE